MLASTRKHSGSCNAGGRPMVAPTHSTGQIALVGASIARPRGITAAARFPGRRGRHPLQLPARCDTRHTVGAHSICARKGAAVPGASGTPPPTTRSAKSRLYKNAAVSYDTAAILFAICFLYRIFRSSCTNSSMMIGLERKPFMPQSRALFLSSSKALAVMARIGMPARAGFSSARICRVAS